MYQLSDGSYIPGPTSFMLMLTQDCQLRCKYCFEHHAKNEVMTFDIAKKAIDMLAENCKQLGKQPAVSLFGGEPLLVWDELFVPIVDYIRSTYDSYSIVTTTNGLLLDEAKMQYLMENGVGMMLSIDGAKLGHNATRRYIDGRETWPDMERIVDLIISHRPDVPFRMTVTPANVEYIMDSVNYFHSKGVMTLRMFPNVYEDWDDIAIGKLDGQLKLYNDYIYREFDNGGTPLIFDSYEYMFKKILVDQYSADNNIHRGAYFCQTCNRCGVGYMNNFMLNYSGLIFTCDRDLYPDESNPCYVGDIYSGLDITRLEALRQAADGELSSVSMNCSECALNRVCSGGCVPVNRQITGSFLKVPDSYCKYNQIMYSNVRELLESFESNRLDRFKSFLQTVMGKGRFYVG